MQAKNLPLKLIVALTCLLPSIVTQAQFNPLTLAGKVVSTAMDARSKSEVANDTEIAAGANKRLLDDKKAEWKGVTLLVFAQHVVLAGAVQSDESIKHVAEVVRQDKRVRSACSRIRRLTPKSTPCSRLHMASAQSTCAGKASMATSC